MTFIFAAITSTPMPSPGNTITLRLDAIFIPPLEIPQPEKAL
jgi:hypothetical protein